MAEKKKGGLINRLIMGSEKSETYARSTLPTNRWGLFWDIVKTRFTKLLLVNLLILLFLLPLFAVLILKYLSVASMGVQYPFSQNIGMGYPAFPLMQGMTEAVNLQSCFIYILLPVAAVFAAIGISGGFYIMRNIVWTEGIFVANDFWRGIKLNFGQILLTCLLYSLFFWLSNYMLEFTKYAQAIGSSNSFLLSASVVCNYIFLGFITIMVMYMFSICVTYKCSYFKLIKNAFLLTLGLLPQNLFFMFLGLIPVLLLLIFGISTSSIFGSIALIIFIFIGPVLLTLVWTNYSQWVFDKFINDKVPGAQKNRGIYEKVGKSDSKSLQQYKAQMEKFSNSSLSNKPIKPITDEEIKLVELPTTFNRADLQKLADSKKAMYEDNERYIEEHKNDAKYTENSEQDDNANNEENVTADYLKTKAGKKNKEKQKEE